MSVSAIARGFCFSPVAAFMDFANSKATGKAKSPSDVFGGISDATRFKLDVELLAAALSYRLANEFCISNSVIN